MTTVLVVDDDPIIVKLLSENLENNGYAVLSARNGEVGLTTALEKNPDIILLDLMMPVMDGLEMLAKLRKTSEIPVIIISAFGSSDKVEAARELGIECFMNKPFDLGVLVEVLNLMFSPECSTEAQEL